MDEKYSGQSDRLIKAPVATVVSRKYPRVSVGSIAKDQDSLIVGLYSRVGIAQQTDALRMQTTAPLKTPRIDYID